MHRIAAVIALLTLSSAPAHAGFTYALTATLDLTSTGVPDSMGLQGAVVRVEFTVAAGAVFFDHFGSPGVVVENPTITISGSSAAANNGTFAMDGPIVLAPADPAGFFADYETVGYEGFVTVTLPVGGVLGLQVNTRPTADGLTAAVGDLVRPEHFGPTITSGGSSFFNIPGRSYYWLRDASVATTEAVPEPASAALMGLALAGLAAVLRRSA